MIEENIRAAKEFGICGTAIPATDTLLQSKDGAVISAMPDRAQMYQMQTPQSFLYGLFLKVYTQMTTKELAAATDVCRLFFAAGYDVRLVAGSPQNLKITVPLDLKIAEGILKEKETKE